MRQVHSPTAPLWKKHKRVEIVDGGTSAETADAAVDNLGGLSRADADKPGGPVLLTIDQKIPSAVRPDNIPPAATLVGKTEVGINAVETYTISNYSEFVEYNITVSVGTVSRSGAEITFTAPGAEGSVLLTINNQSRIITVLDQKPAKPTVLTPIVNSENVGKFLNAEASAFVMTGGAGTHESSDWEVAFDPSFASNTIINSTSNSTLFKTTYATGALAPNTQYYMRVRYKASTGVYGPWSDTHLFKTRPDFAVMTEEAKMTYPEQSGSGNMGQSVALDGSGTRLVVGFLKANSTNTGSGLVLVFVRNGATWSREAILQPSGSVTNSFFGSSVAISRDGTRLAATEELSNKVRLFKRMGASWSFEADLVVSAPGVNPLFGSVRVVLVAFSGDGQRIVVGYPGSTSVASGSAVGHVAVFAYANNAWTQETAIPTPISGSNSYFGSSVCIDYSGSRIGVGDIAQTTLGYFWIYHRTNNTWVLEQSVRSDAASSSNFGLSSALNDEGRLLVVGEPIAVVSGKNSGRVLVYSRNGTTWTLIQTIAPPYTANPLERFGYSLSIDNSGGFLVVGASLADFASKANSGLVSTYYLNGLTFQYEVAKAITVPGDSLAGANFGSSASVAADTSRFAVGARMDTVSGLTQAGSAYTFK